MGFKIEYSGAPHGSYHPSGNTILPFWGFDEYERSLSHSRTVYVNDDRYRTGKRAVHGTDYTYYDYFSRCRRHSPNQELEDRFVDLLAKKKIDVLDTPYVCTSLREYFEKNDIHYHKILSTLEDVFPILSKICLAILPLSFIALTLVFYFNPDMADGNPVIDTIFTISMIGSVILYFAFKGLAFVAEELHDSWKRKQKEKRKLENLSEAELNKFKEQYLNSMNIYGDAELKAILQQVAIENGYLDI